MTVKQVARSATVAFAPSGPYMATGTMAGAIDLSFSTTACVEIFGLDLTQPETDMPLIGQPLTAEEKFHRLSWGVSGLLAGGLADGMVCVWNPEKMLSGEAATGTLVAKLQKHSGAVKGLEFNTFSPNLLATGAQDGELCIWDLTDPAAPSMYPALKASNHLVPQGGSSQGSQGEISHLSWNRKVQHILASTSINGNTVIWDLKRQKPVISFVDPSMRRRCSALQWNPDVPTQLIVASDDDRSPSLQVWDLRNSISPLRELTEHSKGVLAMAWCPSDSALLLTCAKDNRTLCWDTHSGEVLCELPPSENWNFDVQWAPRTPGIFSTSSFDSNVTLHNLQDLSKLSTTATDSITADFRTVTETSVTSTAMKRAPTWLRRPIGASFGFGSKLVTFQAKADTSDKSEVHIHSVVTEEGLVGRSDSFEVAVGSAHRDSIRTFCESKAVNSSDPEDKQTWAFLRILYEPDARRQLLAHLDFADAPVATVENGLTDATEQLTDKVAQVSVSDSPAVGGVNDDGESFFENLGTQPLPPVPPPPPSIATDNKDSNGTADEVDMAVQRALVLGNYEAAVAACIAADRLADALLLASVGGTALWQKTQDMFILRHPRPYMRLMSAVMKKDLFELIKVRPLHEWKETLALLCTYAAPREWAPLCEALAARLLPVDPQAATLCYICAGSIEQAVSMWSQKYKTSSKASVETLQDIIEKAVVLSTATGRKHAGETMSKLITGYAELLASQGRLVTAMQYLGMVKEDESFDDAAVLKDRIYRSGNVELPPDVPQPAFPFQLEEPQATTSEADSQQQHQQQQQQQQEPQYAAAQQSYQTAYQTQPASTTAYQQAAPVGSRKAVDNTLYPTPAMDTSAYSSVRLFIFGAANHDVPSLCQSIHQVVDIGLQQYQQPSTYAPQPGASSQQYYTPATTAAPPQYTAPSQYAASSQYTGPSMPTVFTPPQQTYSAPEYQPPANLPPQQPTMMKPAPVATPAPPSYQLASGPPAYQAPSAMMPQGPPRPGAYAPPAGVFVPKNIPPPLQPMQPMQPAPSVPQPQMQRPGGPQGPPPPMQVLPPQAMQPQQMQMQMQPQTMPLQPQQLQQQSMPAPLPPAAQPAPPPSPPVNVVPTNISMGTVDTSQVQGNLKPIVSSLTRLYETCAGAAANHPAKRREMDDNSKRIATLLFKLNIGDVSPGVVDKLLQLCKALDAGDFASANHLQVALTMTDWDECGVWLSALKRLLKSAQPLR
eukprot:jgi/Chlat1/8985/Chrsp94S08270